MHYFSKLSRVLVAGILAVVALYTASGTAFAYSYNVYDYSEANVPGRSFRLAIPKGLSTVKGVLVVINATGSDLRDHYTYPVYEEFMNMYGFAFVGTVQCNSHLDCVQEFQRALAQFAKDSGHAELLNAPFVATGVSAGGGFSSTLATNYPDKVIAAVPCCARFNLSGVTQPTTSLLSTPVLDMTGDGGGTFVNPNLKAWRPAPHNALWSWVDIQGVGDAYVMQEVLSMPYLEKAVQLRYPHGGDPSKGPVTLKTLTPGSGWIADNTTMRSGLTAITPASQFTGDRGQSSWLPDKDLAYAFRAYATKDFTPGYKNDEFSDAIREIRLTSPKVGMWYVEVQDPGPVTMKVDAAIFAKNFPTWSKLEFYDGATKLGEATPPDTTTSLTAQILKPGYHVLSVLGYDASGKAIRTSNPVLLIVRGTYQY